MITFSVPKAFEGTQLHEPLPPQSAESAFIRVLDLHRDSRDPDEPLRGTLRLVNLRECPSFTALSYVWGAYSDVPDTIRCGHHDFPISKNCYNALRSLRRLYGEITIWVDAICINQKDEDEKNAQIRLMHEVYTWAHTVYAWLGEGTQRTDRAVKCLKLASALRRSPRAIPWTDGGSVKTLRLDRTVSILALTYMYWQSSILWFHVLTRRVAWSFDKCSLEELLNSDWIRRAWTYQEIVLASNPIVLCGDKAITWSQFQRGLDYLNDPVIPYRPLWRDYVPDLLYYQDPKKTVHKRYNQKVSHEARSLESFHIWRQIHRVWGTVCRPSSWNKRQFRRLPGDNAESPVLYSARNYEFDLMQPEKSLFWARLILTLPNIGLMVFGIAEAVSQYHEMPNKESAEFSGAVFNFICEVLTAVLSFIVAIGAMKMAPYEGHTDEEISTPLIGLVQALRQRQATIPADQAFSLHAVLHGMRLSASELDYTKTYAQVYHALFLDLLRQNTSLVNLLIDAGHRLPGVPSWVPDWSNLHERSWLDSQYLYDHANLYGASFPEPQIKIANDTLGIWCIMKGRVAFCSGLFPRLRDQNNACHNSASFPALRQAVTNFAEWIEAIPKNVLIHDSHGENKMIHDIHDVLIGQPSTPSGIETSSLAEWLRCIPELPFENEPEHEQPACQNLEDIFTANPHALEFTLDCSDRLAGKRGLFITQDGKLGTGPCGMLPGDQLALLRGVAVPMVIRKTGEGKDTFEVVGPAFVSPIMDVDAFNETTFGPDWEPVILV